MTAPNWKNRTIWTGDNPPIMRGLNSESVDLIYLDPPFNSNQDYAAPIGSKAAGAAFKDTWTLDDVDRLWLLMLRDKDHLLFHVIEAARLVHGKGMASYLSMMAQRLEEMKRILKPTGSIYLHCDPTASHYLKILMDAVFGEAYFCNEIVWKRTTAHNDPKRFGRTGDRILFFTKSKDKVFNPVLGPLSPEQRKRYRYQDEEGYYKAENLTAPHFSPTRTVEWRGTHPGSDRQWRFHVDELERLYEAGRILNRRDGLPRKDGLKEYLHESEGAFIQDIWTDSVLSPTSGERLGYPTQKPITLLERIVQASSNEGDRVLDPFCGCATACVAAERHGRQWFGIDISEKAAELVQVRIRKEIDLFHDFKPIHRTDQPQRTDLGKLSPPSAHKDVLYGKQSGQCGGCMVMFHKRNLTLDHIVPRAYGGTDHVDNLWLLCGACNSSKGTKSQAEFLKERVKRGESIEWFIN